MTDPVDVTAVFGRRARQPLLDFCRFADLAAGLVAQGRTSYDSNIYLRLAAEAIEHRMGEAIGRLPAGAGGVISVHRVLTRKRHARSSGASVRQS